MKEAKLHDTFAGKADRTMANVPRRRSRTLIRTLGAAVFGMIAATSVIPIAANASGHSCSSGDVCVFNNASFDADPEGGLGVTNPWSAFSGGYYNMSSWPSPHTYNNPDVCNNVYAFWAICNLNDTISAAKNKDSTYKVRLFNDAGYSGNYQTLRPLTSDSQVTYNDQISSECWNAGTVCTF
ncbi:MAG: hypothetical protein QM677_06625 [Microbacterium sp.]